MFPAQSGRFFDFENFGMVASVQDLLEQGRLQLFCLRQHRLGNLGAFDRPSRGRIERHEAYARYIVEELAPRILELNQWSNGGQRAGGILTTGHEVSRAARGELHVPLAGFVQRHDRFERHLFQQVVLRRLYGRSGLQQFHDRLSRSDAGRSSVWWKNTAAARYRAVRGQGDWNRSPSRIPAGCRSRWGIKIFRPGSISGATTLFTTGRGGAGSFRILSADFVNAEIDRRAVSGGF